MTESTLTLSEATAPAATSIALLSPAVGTGNVGDHFIELAIRRLLSPTAVFHHFSIRRELRGEEIERINQTSCALICGTNLYQHDWESALTPKKLQRIAVPVIPFGVGSSAARLTETAVSEVTRSMIRAIHERCAMGSVRDPHALRVVERTGVKNVVLTGCPVLFWAGRDQVPPVEPRPRPRLVLTARNWLMHRWPHNVDHPVQIELLRRVVDHFRERVPMVFAVHEEFDRRLVDLLRLPAATVLDASDAHEYVRLYSDPDNVVLALRLHAGIAARAYGLPAVFVGHDTRTYAFCDMTGIECVDLFTANAADICIARLQQALAGEPGTPERAGEVFGSLQQAMRRFILANKLPYHQGQLA